MSRAIADLAAGHNLDDSDWVKLDVLRASDDTAASLKFRVADLRLLLSGSASEDRQDKTLEAVQPCSLPSVPHSWLPITGKGLQCFSCPMCRQCVYWSELTKRWVKVTPKVGRS